MKLFKKSGAQAAPDYRRRRGVAIRFMARTSALSVLVFGLLAMIFWNANFYAARDRWEHFKLAAFGDWQDTGWCPPGHRADRCTPLTTLEEALARADSLHFFKSVPIEGTDLQVTTGAVFATTQDIIEGNAGLHWCYIAAGQGALRSHIELGNQLGRDAPVYTRAHELEKAAMTPAMSDASFTSAQLKSLGQTHCRFGAFNRAGDDPAL